MWTDKWITSIGTISDALTLEYSVLYKMWLMIWFDQSCDLEKRFFEWKIEITVMWNKTRLCKKKKKVVELRESLVKTHRFFN